MHLSSYCKMKKFRQKYLADKENKKLVILDIGSQDINGSYKDIFNSPEWKYRGVDMCKGKNVDIVLSDIYNWKEIRSRSVDVVISGQAFEHIEYIWLTMSEIYRVLKHDGLCCIIAPSNGREHKYPIDCWRIYPDGFRALAKYAKLEPIEVYTQWGQEGYEDGSDMWHDSVLIAKKVNCTASKKGEDVELVTAHSRIPE